MEQCLNKLCNSCKKTKCDKSIVITTEDNLVVIKCLDYEKDETKIHPYKKPLKKTARLQRTVMGLSGCDWGKGRC